MSFFLNSASNSISNSFQKMNKSQKLKLNSSLKALKTERNIIKRKIKNC
jgi:hypothetical protein